MSLKQPLVVNSVDWSKLLSTPPVLDSFQSGWKNIQLAHYRQPTLDFPEVSGSQHILVIPLKSQAYDLEITADGHFHTVSYRDQDFASGCIEIYPAGLPFSVRSISTVHSIEWLQCYLDVTVLAQVAHESINPDHVELLQTPKKPDLLIHQMALVLRSSLATDGTGSRFYADSMAIALAAHLLRHYATRQHRFREYEDGLSKQKLKHAIEYIETHLGEALSLNEIATELGMSQYYFCRLFKRSTGMTPHQYLLRQRVERAKYLLKQTDRTITSVALECGFASQSHFAKCFRHHTQMNPKQFRKL